MEGELFAQLHLSRFKPLYPTFHHVCSVGTTWILCWIIWLDLQSRDGPRRRCFPAFPILKTSSASFHRGLPIHIFWPFYSLLIRVHCMGVPVIFFFNIVKTISIKKRNKRVDFCCVSPLLKNPLKMFLDPDWSHVSRVLSPCPSFWVILLSANNQTNQLGCKDVINKLSQVRLP